MAQIDECSICFEHNITIVKTYCGCTTKYCQTCYNNVIKTLGINCTVCKNNMQKLQHPRIKSIKEQHKNSFLYDYINEPIISNTKIGILNLIASEIENKIHYIEADDIINKNIMYNPPEFESDE